MCTLALNEKRRDESVIVPPMDSTDIVLAMTLLQDSRTSYQKLADQLGLSVNAVHKRIQLLMTQGIIRKFNARISLSSLKALNVLVYGNSKAAAPNKLHNLLGNHGSIYWVSYSGGNYLYIGAYLRDISDLGSLVNYIKEKAEIPEPTVGIESSGSLQASTYGAEDKSLYPLDYRIIHSLHDNSRKPLSDVAEEVGISAKTARLRLARMIKYHLVEFSLEWYPDASNDIITIFHARLKPSPQKNVVGHLFKEYVPNVIVCWAFSNLPNEMLVITWTDSVKNLRVLESKLEADQSLESVTPNILYSGYVFDTWRDRLLTERARSK